MMNYKVYYAKNPVIGGIPELYPDYLARLETLPYTHVLVKEVEAESAGHVYSLMQSEEGPFGGTKKSRAYIQQLGLNHTTMCNGDVVEDENGVFYECLAFGWRLIEPSFPNGHQPSKEELQALIPDSPPEGTTLSYTYQRISVFKPDV